MTATRAATLSQATSPATSRAAADALVAFLETGEAAPDLFAADVFCDLTVPTWRLQAAGRADVVALRLNSHPAPGRITATRVDPTPTGFVLEFEERWRDGGDDWYCRELIRADVGEHGISGLSVYCTGDWDTARVAEHAAAVRLIRP